MAFLIDQIKEQKILEMEVAVDQFIKDNNISESAMIFEMQFSKEVFAEEKEVREYLKDKYFFSPEISEHDDYFTAKLVPANQVDESTEIEIELRRGVIAYAADLNPVPRFEEIAFNEKGEVMLTSKCGTIDLSDGSLPHIIEIARVAEGEHPAYGKLKITQEHLEAMALNFKSNVTGVDLAVNEDHKKNEAFGWFKDVFLSFDGQVLYGQVAWNAKGTRALSEKEYRYFSPEFRFNYVHPHTGAEHGPTLLGGALTNYPFLKMDAIVELNNKKQGAKAMNDQTIALSEYTKKVEENSELKGKVTDLEKQVETQKANEIELSTKIKDLEEKVAKQDKEAAHKKLFDEGKINKAQLVALNEGKTFLEVLALNEKMNTAEKGSDTPDKETKELSAKEQDVAAQLGLTAEEFNAVN